MASTAVEMNRAVARQTNPSIASCSVGDVCLNLTRTLLQCPSNCTSQVCQKLPWFLKLFQARTVPFWSCVIHELVNPNSSFFIAQQHKRNLRRFSTPSHCLTCMEAMLKVSPMLSGYKEAAVRVNQFVDDSAPPGHNSCLEWLQKPREAVAYS